MYNLDVEPIHWEPMPIQDHSRWWAYGAMSKSKLTIEGKEYGIILRIWSDVSLYHTDRPLEDFYCEIEKTYPDHDSVFSGVLEGTLEKVLNDAHLEYLSWIRHHSNRLFQLSAFCTMLNKLYAINHLDSEEEEEE